jgi:hypothetical protein
MLFGLSCFPCFAATGAKHIGAKHFGNIFIAK